MTSLIIIAAFIQSIFFKFWEIRVKHLQERGFSILEILSSQKLVIIPSTLLVLMTYRKEYLDSIMNNGLVLFAFLFTVSVWMIHSYMKLKVQESVNSLAFLNVFFAVITLPIYLIVGMTFNGDTPNMLMIISLMILTIAVLIKPSAHENNTKQTFQHVLKFIVFLSVGGILVDALNNGAYRYFLTDINAPLFGAALSMLFISIIINIFFLFKKIRSPKLNNDTKLLFYSLSVIWIIASIPEGFALL